MILGVSAGTTMLRAAGRSGDLGRSSVRILWLALVCAFVIALPGERSGRVGDDAVYDSIFRNRRFDFVSWELLTLSSKARYALAPPHTYVDTELQKRIVVDWTEQLSSVQRLEAQVAAVYADPSVGAPERAAADMVLILQEARRGLAAVQPMAEGIIQEQVAAVLADTGLTWAGRVFPPVQLHFTPLPAMLVVSPRDRIEAVRFVPLVHGLDEADRLAIETAVDQQLGVSSLVVNIGGLGAYPAMLFESTALDWVLNTAAHEWTHHYLTLRPLGIRYDANPELRTMNETTASIVGNEIGAQALLRFYPERIPPLTQTGAAASNLNAAPPAFDFRAEMRQTRLTVDALLEEGRIAEAESHMEARRQVFWANGYQIRKLNQAYFAFYGAYADEPGEQGEDPVGPAVVALRQKSPSLQAFLESVAALKSYADLEALLASQ